MKSYRLSIKFTCLFIKLRQNVRLQRGKLETQGQWVLSEILAELAVPDRESLIRNLRKIRLFVVISCSNQFCLFLIFSSNFLRHNLKYTLFQKYLAHGLLGMIRTSLLEGKVQFLDGFVVVTEAKAKNISNF